MTPHAHHSSSKLFQIIQYLVLSLLVALPMLATDILLPALPTMAKELVASDYQIKQVLVIYMLGFATSILCFGILSDKYGRKPCIKVSLLIFLGATLMCCFVQNIEQLIALRFLQAMGAGSMTVLVRAVIRDCYDERTSVVVLSTISSVMTLSTLVAPVFGSVLFLQFGWMAIFVMLLLLASIGLACVERFIPVPAVVQFINEEQVSNAQVNNAQSSTKVFNTKHLNPNYNPVSLNPVAQKQDESSHDINVSQLAVLLKHAIQCKPFVGYTIVISLIWSAFFCFVMDASFVFQQWFLLSPSVFAMVFSAISMGYIAGSMTSRKLIAIYDSDRLILIGLLVCCVSLLLGNLAMFWWFHAVLVSVITFVFLFGCGLIVPNCQSRSLAQFDSHIGFYASIFYAVEMATTGVVSAIKTQLLIMGYGSYVLMMGLSVLALLGYWRLCRRCN